MERTVGTPLPLLDRIVEHHDALIDASDAARTHDFLDALEELIEATFVHWIVVSANEVHALAVDARAQFGASADGLRVPLARSEEIAEVHQDVLRADHRIDRGDVAVIHRRNISERTRKDFDRLGVPEVGVGGHEDPPRGLDKILRD